jgi:hypothetical protein
VIKVSYQRVMIDPTVATDEGVLITFQTEDGHKIGAVFPPEAATPFGAALLESNGVVKLYQEDKAKKKAGSRIVMPGGGGH